MPGGNRRILSAPQFENDNQRRRHGAGAPHPGRDRGRRRLPRAADRRLPARRGRTTRHNSPPDRPTARSGWRPSTWPQSACAPDPARSTRRNTMRHARWVPAKAGTAALDETERHVRAHLSSVADGADDLDRYTAAVQVCRVDGEGGTTVEAWAKPARGSRRRPVWQGAARRRGWRSSASGSGLMFARAVMDGLARHGVPVLTENGWETRGNGQTADYQGAIMHHTAARSSARNPEPSRRIVVDGRPDLRGPLYVGPGWVRISARYASSPPTPRTTPVRPAAGRWARCRSPAPSTVWSGDTRSTTPAPSR